MENTENLLTFTYENENIKRELTAVSKRISEWPAWKLQACKTMETNRKNTYHISCT